MYHHSVAIFVFACLPVIVIDVTFIIEVMTGVCAKFCIVLVRVTGLWEVPPCKKENWSSQQMQTSTEK